MKIIDFGFAQPIGRKLDALEETTYYRAPMDTWNSSGTPLSAVLSRPSADYYSVGEMAFAINGFDRDDTKHGTDLNPRGWRPDKKWETAKEVWDDNDGKPYDRCLVEVIPLMKCRGANANPQMNNAPPAGFGIHADKPDRTLAKVVWILNDEIVRLCSGGTNTVFGGASLLQRAICSSVELRLGMRMI